MDRARTWVRIVSVLVPASERAEWIEQWEGELTASGGSMRHALGAMADAWYLRTEGWTMDGLARDVRTAVRGLIRRPLFTVVAGMTLAVGIAANTAIYTVVDGVLINPLPFPDAHELVSYNHEAPGLGVNVPVIPHSDALFMMYLERAREVESFAVMTNTNVTLVSDADPQQLTAAVVTQEYFDVLGVHPFIGRGFAVGEDRPGAEPVVVLANSLWQQSFGGDPAVIGTLVEMDGVQRRVIGIMPSDFGVLDEDVWLPLEIDPDAPDSGSLSHIGLARLREGATAESADTEMHDLLYAFADEGEDDMVTGIMQAGLDSDVKPLKELIVEDVRPVLWVLLGTVGIVLLVACANVANLFLVRAEARHREQALRRAIGASRLDVFRQHMTESITLALASGVVAVGLATFGVKGLLALAPADLPQALRIGIDPSVLVFTFAISLASGILFGLLPAVGPGGRDLSNALKDGGRSSTGGRDRMRARNGLVVAQVAMALVLLVGSGLMLRSFNALRTVDPGFAPDGVLTFAIGLPNAEYSEPSQVLDFHRQLDERLAALPGVSLVGAATGIPLTGAKSASPMEPVDNPLPEGELGPMIEVRQVTPGYWDAMEIDLLEGRTLGWDDQADGRRAVVISKAMADAFWPGQSAVGRLVRGQGAENSWEVVGVTADVRFDSVEDDPLPMVYYPLLRGSPEEPAPPLAIDLVLRTSGDPLQLVEGARSALRGVDPKLPMINPRTVRTVVDDSLAATSFAVVLLGIAAAVALLLGTVGLYGVVAYLVSRRTQEIGVRMALGAPAGTVLKSFVTQGLRLTAIGLVLGLIASIALGGAMTSLLYGVQANDPLTLAGTAALLAFVSTLATWIPARRAARVDPVRALKAE
ncbi:MAG: ABC transporter permease [Gemmatimonadota bacterium]